MTRWSRKIPFQVDIAGVIHLMSASLYSRPEAAIREVLQNAHDAIMRKRRTDLGYRGRIVVIQNPAECSLQIEDDGVGLSVAEAETYLGTLGMSLTGTLKGRPDEMAQCADLIGQFGIGLFSAFMLADRLEVDSRRADADEAVHWSAGRDADITLSSSERALPGTCVTLHLDAEHAKLSTDSSLLEAAIREYADYLPIPIHLNDAPVRLNRADASWFSPTVEPDALAEEIHTAFDETPLEVIPIRLEQPVGMAGALYVTPRRTPGFSGDPILTTTVRRMVISRRTQGLLPDWAPFLRGVLELPDCSPTTSREDLARDASFHRVRRTLDEYLYEYFERLAHEYPARFQSVLAWHRYSWAGAAAGDPRLRRLLRNTYPFLTTRGPLTFEAILEESAGTLTLNTEADRLIWFHADRRQETWIDSLFANRTEPCVHATRGFDQVLLASLAADATEQGLTTELCAATSESAEFASTVLGARDVEDAPEEWSRFLDECGARVCVASLDPEQPVLALLNERHELLRALDELNKQGIVPPGFRQLIDRHMGGSEPSRHELLLNRNHVLVGQALQQSTRTPLASVLRLLACSALASAGATLPSSARTLQEEDLAWIAECLRGRKPVTGD